MSNKSAVLRVLMHMTSACLVMHRLVYRLEIA